MKPIFVGESLSSLGGAPLRGRAGKLLASVAGIGEDELFRLADAVNLLGGVQRKQDRGKGRTFDVAEAEKCAERLLKVVGSRRPLILLGRRVARAFGIVRREAVWRDGRFAGIPHPSGIVYWWNLAKNRREAAKLLRQLLPRRD
jgi:hypothetical protein